MLIFTKWFVRVVLVLAVLICAFAAIAQVYVRNWQAAAYMLITVVVIGFGTISYFKRDTRAVQVEPMSRQGLVVRLGLFWSVILLATGFLVYLFRTHV